MASAKASASPSGVFLAPFLVALPDSVTCSICRQPMRSSAAADEAHQAMTTTWESHWNAESPGTCDCMIPGKRIPNSCKCVVSTPGHVLRNWKSHTCFLRLSLFSFHPVPRFRETIETVEARFNNSELSVRSWASQLSISHLHSSLMISSRPFITAASIRIGEILRAALVNRWIFSAFLCNGKRQNEQIPVVLIPKSRALFWHGNLQKGSTTAYGRGGQTYWSESDGPEETGVLPGSSMPLSEHGLSPGASWKYWICLYLDENLRALLGRKEPTVILRFLLDLGNAAVQQSVPESPTHRNYWQTWR